MLKDELVKYAKDVSTYLAASNGIGIVLLDSGYLILECNMGFMRLFNPHHNPSGEPLSNYLELSGTNIHCGEELRLACSPKTGINSINYCHLIQIETGFLLFCERRLLTESRALEQIGSMNDDLINIQRELVKKNYLLGKVTSELDLRVTELEAALDRVKRLEGIISICMFCKKIRNEEESWIALEKYISEHSDAVFSHGICPVCFEKHYP